MNEFQSLLFYIFIVVAASLLASISVNKRNQTIRYVPAFLSFSIVFIIAAFRYNVGSDYYGYIRIFNEISNNSLSWALTSLRTEPLYGVLNWGIYTVFSEHIWIFIVTSLITHGLIFTAIYRNRHLFNVGLAVFIYLLSYYFGFFTTVRSALAASIIFWAYKYLVNKNVYKYFFSVFVAIGFHYTAVIMIPVWFLINTTPKNGRLKYGVIVGLTLIVLLLFPYILEVMLEGTKYYSYLLGSRFGNLQSGLNQIILISPLIVLIMLYYKRLYYKSKMENSVYLQLFFIGSLFTLFTLWLGILDRMTTYLMLSQILIIPQILRLTNKKEFFLLSYGIVLYYLILFVYFTWDSRLLPYEMILFLV